MKPARSIQDCVNRLNAINYDPEIAHAEADALLLDALLLLGQSEVVDAYLSTKNRVVFWYA